MAPSEGLKKGVWETITAAPGETRRLAEKVGRLASAGTLIALLGDLGSGKTVFAQGLARGLGVGEDQYVTSPTYTLIHEYPGRHRLYHVDLYRLGGPEEMEEIGLWEILGGSGVVAVEWAERLGQDLPAARLAVRFESDPALPDTSRRIRFTAHGRAAEEILEGVRPE